MDINNINQLIVLGYKAFNQKNYEQAIMIWQPIINFCQYKKFDELAKVYLDLGKCYYHTQKYNKAKIVITQGLEKFSDDINLLKLEGFNEEKLNNYELAIQAWEKVLRQYPKHIEAKNHIHDIRKQIERQQQINQISVDVKEILLEIDKNIDNKLYHIVDKEIETKFINFPNNYQLLLKYAQNAQDSHVKLQRYITLVKLYPYSKEAFFNLMQVYEETKQFELAKLSWHKFVRNNNIDYSLYKLYAEVIEKNEPREAFFRWLEIYRKFPTNMEIISKIEMLSKDLNLQRYQRKKEISLQQMLSEKHQINQLFVDGKKEFDIKNYLKSNEIWQRAVDLADDKSLISADLYLGLGKSYIRSGELDKAKNLITQALIVYPQNYNIHFLLPFIAKKEQDWAIAGFLWENLSNKFPKEMSAKIELAQNYQQLNELVKAKKVYQDAIHLNNNYFDAYLGLARVMMKQGEHQGSLEVWLGVKDKWPEKINGHLGAAICYKNLEKYNEAFQVVEQALITFPDNEQLLNEFIDIIYRSQDYQYGYDRLKNLKQSIGFSRQGVLEYQEARLLAKLKRFEEAENKFKAIIDLYPNYSRVYLGFADFYTQQKREQDAVELLELGCSRFNNDQLIVEKLIQALVSFGEKDRAYQVYSNLLQDKQSVTNLFKYRNLINQFDNQKIDLVKLHKENPNHVEIAVKLANILLDTYDTSKQNEGIEILKNVKKQNPSIGWINNTLVMGLLKANRENEALEIAKMVPVTQRDPDSLKILAWLANKQGEFEKSKEIWSEIISKKHIVSVSGKIGNLTYKGKHEIRVAKSDIVLFSTMFNEMIHIPFLLDYYRKLGVNKFFIVDNNSTDDTAEYLLSQPDVYYFWNDSSFKEAGCGLAWLNHLMDKYAQENWCVVVDADEYLVYPNIENKKLPELTKYLDEHGYEALASFMLAMYPEDVQHQIAIQPGDNLIEKSPYFCNFYYFKGDVHCPYIHVSGGFYYKKNKQTTWCTKTPLIKRNNGIKHIAANHLITSAKVADITSCLLHLKLVGDFEKKAKLHIERKEHSGGGDAYKEYVRLYAGNGKFTDVEGTTKFENSQQLIELGLIKNPRGF